MGRLRDFFSRKRPAAVEHSTDVRQLDERAAGGGAIAYRFHPRRVRFRSEGGWDVRVLDEVTGEELRLAPPYVPVRTAPGATPASHVTQPMRHELREGGLYVDEERVCTVGDLRNPTVRVRGAAWCVVNTDDRRVLVGRVGHTPRALELGLMPSHVWIGEEGLAYCTPFIVAFIPFDVLERDGEVRVRPIDVRDGRATKWTPATVSHPSESFALVATRFGRKNFVWPDAGFATDEALELADFVGEFDPSRAVGMPTLMRRRGVVMTLEPTGVPSSPLAESVPLGVASAAPTEPRELVVNPVLVRLRELGLLDAVTRPSAIDSAILEFEKLTDASCAAGILQHVYGFAAGQPAGFVAYDYRFMNDTEDPVADFSTMCAEERLVARTISIAKDFTALTLELRAGEAAAERHTLDLRDDFFEQLGKLFNDALAALDANRRMHWLETGADYYAFLACPRATADALAQVGTELGVLGA